MRLLCNAVSNVFFGWLEELPGILEIFSVIV